MAAQSQSSAPVKFEEEQAGCQALREITGQDPWPAGHLVVLKANATMAPEASVGGASLQVLEGRLRVQTDGQVHELGPGQIVILTENLHEPIQAAERSAFLLTVAWPEGAGAWAEEEAADRL